MAEREVDCGRCFVTADNEARAVKVVVLFGPLRVASRELDGDGDSGIYRSNTTAMGTVVMVTPWVDGVNNATNCSLSLE